MHSYREARQFEAARRHPASIPQFLLNAFLQLIDRYRRETALVSDRQAQICMYVVPPRPADRGGWSPVNPVLRMYNY